MWTLVPLGNPGPEYQDTRHNLARLLLQRWMAERDLVPTPRKRFPSGTLYPLAPNLQALVPSTYMNLSGESVAPLARRHGIDDPSSLVIVHDELDLPTGVVRIKVGGGLAGHNGLRSIKAHLHTDAFLRVRIGVGKPPSKEHGADHVLKRVGKADRELLDIAVEIAADAVESILTDGVDAAMNVVNSRPQLGA